MEQPPKYETGERLKCLVPTHNDIVYDRIEVLIVTPDQWLEKDKCWLYRAISTRTNQHVYVKEIDLEKYTE